MSTYEAPWWLPGGHLQTIFAALAPAPRVPYRRERWDTPDGDFILDGPTATRADIQRAAKDVLDGGLFRYFFRYPTMLVGKYGVFWQRPMAAERMRSSGELSKGSRLAASRLARASRTR